MKIASLDLAGLSRLSLQDFKNSIPGFDLPCDAGFEARIPNFDS